MNMASTSETGHAKNVSTFEDLISFCTGYGAAYNPSNPALKLTSLNGQLAACQAALQLVKDTKVAYDNATNAREVLFKPLKPFATKLINALAAAYPTSQTIDDARTTINKIQGRRAKAVEVPTEKEIAEGAEPVKKNSTSQQSFDKMIDHFSQLVALLAGEPKYNPNEDEYKVASLRAHINDMKAKNTAVINCYTAVSNARISRDKLLYHETTGMVNVAQGVKQYVKSIFGPKDPQFKQVSNLKFSNPSGD
jgi:hypothetical protein